jgi:hypothetical protein
MFGTKKKFYFLVKKEFFIIFRIYYLHVDNLINDHASQKESLPNGGCQNLHGYLKNNELGFLKVSKI